MEAFSLLSSRDGGHKHSARIPVPAFDCAGCVAGQGARNRGPDFQNLPRFLNFHASEPHAENLIVIDAYVWEMLFLSVYFLQTLRIKWSQLTTRTILHRQPDIHANHQCRTDKYINSS
jgi:hypothetical protein